VRPCRTALLYRGLIRFGLALAPLAGRRRPKVREGLAGRAGILERLARWAASQRDPARPLLWMHAASVGEGRQAEAVLQLVRARHPEWQVAYTFFSPAAAEMARDLPADFSDYLPWDRRQDVNTALDALRPTALVFCKLDLWPELATAAARRSTAVGLVAGTVSPGSRRLRWPAKALLAPGYRVLALAGAIGPDDAARLVRLGVAAGRIEVTGDPRFDSALQRARTVPRDHPLRRFGRSAPTLVAGSTWPQDEAVVLRAYAAVRTVRPDARLVVVPHEPTSAHLAGLDRAARSAGLPNPLRLSGIPGGGGIEGREEFDGAALVVDRVGVLPVFYADATIAYVGGGFGNRGLHSVLEPAAAGVPVLFGPAWQGSPDAADLLRARAAAVVASRFPDWLDLDSGTTLADASPLAALWLALLRHPNHAQEAGRRGRICVEEGLGGADRNAEIVERLMRGGRGTVNGER